MSLSQAQKLAREADKSTQYRGHLMSRWSWDPHGSTRVTGCAKCLVCGRRSYVDTKPAPNSIDISGDAVAMNCSDEDYGAFVSDCIADVDENCDHDESEAE